MSLKEFTGNKWTKFVFGALLYIAWVIWLGNFWWLFGLIVIFDIYITRKVRWNFWKKRYKEGEKHSAWNEWLDAIIFAVIFVTFINIFFFQAFKIPSSSMERTLYTGDHLFVSKLAYGPRVPQTPLTIPFTHNQIFGKESYSTLIQKDYRRLKGFGQVKRG
ncbi:MAG: S26 family signal peptidase, partial [Candidatus Cryptobacteroides sp.]|nr:S26 family signal peptidase [Rikenellaceae bacterium]MDY5746760.1 S26 family signal peptidase [Candidatus Cryptobacteroides sp.]